MFDFSLPFDLETKTIHGIDKLDIMIHFISVIETKNSKVKSEFNRFKSFLVEKLKRGLTPQEEINLAEGIVKYLQSEQETNERIKAMNYLFNLEFLTEPTNEKVDN